MPFVRPRPRKYNPIEAYNVYKGAIVQEKKQNGGGLSDATRLASGWRACSIDRQTTCHLTPRCATPRHATSPPGTSRHVTSRHSVPWHHVFSIQLFVSCHIGSHLPVSCHVMPYDMRGWRNTAGNLIEIVWLEKAYHGPQFTGIAMKHRGVRFHRIRDFKLN